MKMKLTVLYLLVMAIPWAMSVMYAYDRGYHYGGQDERGCWTIDPAPADAWIHGEITARRDTKKHPFLKATIDMPRDHSVNSIPLTHLP